MLLSIFTPTHKPDYILETFKSIQKQDNTIPYEWVIVPNGGVNASDLPNEITSNPNVKIVPTELKGIGALKRFACYHCKGDVLVELDHDDLLLEECFSSLVEANNKEPDGFYYSDFINLKLDGSCQIFSIKYGWLYYKHRVDNKEYIVCRAFDPSARSLCQIYFSPNHVRAWSRKAYEKAEGYDENLYAGDDHDLICRTYLSKAPFVYIKKPLYIYRRHDTNSFVIHNREVQIQQNLNMYKYIYPLIMEECRRKDWPIVIGTLDEVSGNKLNINTMLPEFKESSIGCVMLNDILHKISHRAVTPLMNEIYRILVPGGWIVSSTPSIDDGQGNLGRGAFQDPSHQSYWSENNWMYFTKKQLAKLLPNFTGKFQQVRSFTGYPSEWHKEKFIPFVYSDLCCLKGQRQPGLCEI